MTAILALALGIGTNTAIFSIINAALLRPLPFPEADRIVVFMSSVVDDVAAASPAQFNILRAQTAVLQDVSAYRYGKANLTGVDRPEQVQLAEVTTGYFRLFGLSLERGRFFNAGEDRPNGGEVVILSYAFWKRAFAGDPLIIGKIISLAGRPSEVVGVMAKSSRPEAPVTDDPASFRQTIDVWKPFQIDPSSTDTSGYFAVAARLQQGVTLSAANAKLKLATQDFRRRFSGLSRHSVLAVRPMRSVLAAYALPQLSILFVAVGFVLLIACTNVAGLLIARATGRKREIAIRAAVGANRSRIIRQLLTESVTLSLAGGASGLALGIASMRVLLALNSVNIPRIGEYGSNVTLDWRVLLFTVFVSATTGILFGLMPAFDASRADLNDALRESSGRSHSGLRQNKARAALVVTEIAVALILLIGAVQLICSFIAVRFVDPGLNGKDVFTARVSLTGPRFQKTAEVAALVRLSVDRIRALPGVESAASTCCLPLDTTYDHLIGDVIVVGRPLNDRSHGFVNITTVSPGYFDVLKIPLLRGRSFTDRDNRSSAPVVVISQALAHKFWQQNAYSDALKGLLLFPDAPADRWQIIGIVGDIHANGLSAPPPPMVYFPIAQSPEPLTAYIVRSPIAWIVRTHGETGSLSHSIENELRQSSGGLPVTNMRSMNDILARSVSDREFNMLLMSIFGSAALLLAAIGIYGLTAHSVQQRTQEIGIRMALGAESGDVRKMVLLEGMRLVVAGVAIGIVGSLSLIHLVANFLFSVKVPDPTVLIFVPIFLSGVALFAVWLPAQGASRMDPVEALRHE